MLLFADDIALISDTVPGLQNQLNVLKRVSDNLGLVVNTEKTKVVVYRMGGHLARHERWYLGQERLETVNEYKYLGMKLSTMLSSNVAQTELACRAKAGLVQIVKSLRKINNVNPIVFFKLFDARIQPILLYASEIWGFDNCQTVENVHVTAMKKFCDVSTRTPNAMLYGDCGRYPMYINAVLHSVKYWCRLLRMEPSRYPVKVYRMMLNDIEKGYNWASKLRNILLENGMSDVWRAQKIGNEISFMRELKEALVHTYE